MKKIIKLTESDLTRIVRRVIKERDERDEEWGQTDKGEERLQDLIVDARHFLMYTGNVSSTLDFDTVNQMNEYEIMRHVRKRGNDKLASRIEKLLKQEGFEDTTMGEDKTYPTLPKHLENMINNLVSDKTEGFKVSEYDDKSMQDLDNIIEDILVAIEEKIGLTKSNELYDVIIRYINDLLDKSDIYHTDGGELDEGHDDFTTQSRYDDYSQKDHRKLPKGAVKPGKFDFEGTSLKFKGNDDDDFDPWSLDDSDEEYV